MRFLQVLAASLLSFTALAAKEPSGVLFQEFHAKQLSSKASLKLDTDVFNQLTATPRNHSVAVLLTALEPKFGCQLCRDFQPEWEILAKSWTRGDRRGESKMLFGTLDFSKGQEVFRSLMLQTAPVLLLFQPTVGPDAKLDGQPDRYDFSAAATTADPIHDWISRHLPDSTPKPRIVRPINYVKIVTITTATLGLITFFSVAAPYIMPVIQNRNLWAAGSLIAILLFTSGHMYNHIRKVPYVAGDGKGGVSYFAGGFSNQFGLETQVVAAMYGVLSFSTIALALKVPRIADAKAQQIWVFIWGFVMLCMYSFLLNVFRIKNGGYPFWLPPF